MAVPQEVLELYGRRFVSRVGCSAAGVAMVLALMVQTLLRQYLAQVVPRLGDALSWLAFLVVLALGAVIVGLLETRFGATTTLGHAWREYVARRDRTR